jgi:type III pantothenate kinase
MLLVIDLGNTNLTLGLYQGETLRLHWRLATDQARMPDEYGIQILSMLEHGGCKPEELTGICLSSVVPPLTERIIEACQSYLDRMPLVVNYTLNLGIQVGYDDPNAVGGDRLADAAAAWKLYGGPACIIDFGTATTFNALTKDGVYLGGAITAGVGIALDALVRRTAKLPPVEFQAPPNVIGRNTIHAMQSGLIFGYVAMVEGMVARFKAELGANAKVIGTGGLVSTIAAHSKTIEITAPWLTLDGLRIIWELNQQ